MINPQWGFNKIIRMLFAVTLFQQGHYLYQYFRPLTSLWDEGRERHETISALFPSPEYR
jgi:hypothetical protein